MKNVVLLLGTACLLLSSITLASPVQSSKQKPSSLTALDAELSLYKMNYPANRNRLVSLQLIPHQDLKQITVVDSLQQQRNKNILLLITITIMVIIIILMFGYIIRIKTLLPTTTKNRQQWRALSFVNALLRAFVTKPQQNSYEKISYCLQIITSVVQERNINLSIYICPSIPPFMDIDSRNLEREIINLISKAIKEEQNGDIALLIRLDEQQKSKRNLELSVYNKTYNTGSYKYPSKALIQNQAEKTNAVVFHSQIPVTLRKRNITVREKNVYLLSTQPAPSVEYHKALSKRGMAIKAIHDIDSLIRCIKNDENCYRTASIMVIHHKEQNDTLTKLTRKMEQQGIVATSAILVCPEEISLEDEHIYSTCGFGAILKPGHRASEIDNAILITESINRIFINCRKKAPFVIETMETFTYSKPVTKPGKYHNVPILDEDELKQQGAYLPHGHIIKLVKLFTQHNDPNIDGLMNAIQQGRLDEAKTIAHKLKGSAANMKTPRLFHICEEVEHLAADQEKDELQNIRSELNEIYSTTVKELEEYVLGNWHDTYGRENNPALLS